MDRMAGLQDLQDRMVFLGLSRGLNMDRIVKVLIMSILKIVFILSKIINTYSVYLVNTVIFLKCFNVTSGTDQKDHWLCVYGA